MVDGMIRLTVFQVCARILLGFRPKASYEKYLRFLVNFLLLLQFLFFTYSMFGRYGEGDIRMELEEDWLQLEGYWSGREGERFFDISQGGEDGFGEMEVQIESICVGEINVWEDDAYEPWDEENMGDKD